MNESTTTIATSFGTYFLVSFANFFHFLHEDTLDMNNKQ